MTAARARTTAGPGRPRSRSTGSPEVSAVDEILDAAAALFIERGYAATTTRAITDRVGIRQGGLYYHFASKDDVLRELLRRIIAAPLQAAERLADLDGVPASVRLAALVRCDAHELLRAEHNIGSLFLLPEVRRPEFASFRGERERLRGYYLQLISESTVEDALSPLPSTDEAHAEQVTFYLADAVFGLVESVISIREDRPAADRELIESAVQASALRLLGYDGDRLRWVLDEAAGLSESSDDVT